MTEPMITTGVTGRMWRASVAPSGAVLPWEGRPLRWFVAAEDRWHVPDDEPTVRQIRIDGTAVAETRVRVPHGDVVQRVYSVPDADGITIIEVENESTMPVAIAFDHRDVLTERPIADVPVEGIELPAEAFVMPLGHTASIRVGIAHEARREGRLPDGLPAAAQVARGWLTITDRASRFALPDGDIGASLAQRITAERCELALGSIPHVADDPAGFALALHEIVRMGERVDPWLPELVEAVEAIGPQPGWDHDVALVAAGRVLAAAGEDRARRDLGRILDRRATAERPQRPPDGVRAIAWLESLFARGAELLPDDLPDAWLGQSIECYGVPTADTSSVSYAIRWHGARPAVLWEQTGEGARTVRAGDGARLALGRGIRRGIVATTAVRSRGRSRPVDSGAAAGSGSSAAARRAAHGRRRRRVIQLIVRASRRARSSAMCAGPMSQHPPTILAPSSSHASTVSP